MWVFGPTRSNKCRMRDRVIATQPAVGANPGLATWMNTALPRRVTRGRALWLISIMKS